MAAKISPTGPVKVFLWASPRSASTSFLKCMTFVPDTVAWLEPYVQMWKFSLDRNPMSPVEFYGKELLEKHGGKSAIEKIESGYDASDKHIDWIKEQLECDFPGKKLVFVKELGAIFGDGSMRDKIPRGFRHTFLIRNPCKVIASFIKLRQFHASTSFYKKPNINAQNSIYSLQPTKGLNELWKYVKAAGLESRPIIIDADDLFENPKGILEAYCKELGIPFSEDLLAWEAGDDVMTKHWMVPKQTILTYRSLGFHGNTFASTGFKKPDASHTGGANGDHLNQQLPPEEMKLMEEFVKRETPYYEELYDERLKLPESK